MDMYIGIDVAKDFHVAAVVDASGFPVADTTFLNDAAGFALLAEWLASLGLNPENSCICMESTGHYHRLLLHRLQSDGWRVAVVNPVRTDAFRRVRSVRRTKTDLVDAYLIADFLRVERPDAVAPSPGALSDLRRLTRLRSELVKHRTALKNRMAAAVDVLFPELPPYLGGLWSASCRKVLELWPDPGELALVPEDELAEVLRSSSRGRRGLGDARTVQSVARCSIGRCDPCAAFEVRSILRSIASLDDEIKRLDMECQRVLKASDAAVLLTVPGLGPVLASCIAAEVGDARLFRRANSMMAFAGMDATKCQSGKFESSDEHMSKRGSSHLRWALMEAANQVRRRDAYFGDYYDSLKARNKHHYVALSGVARKLCGIIIALWSEQRAYESRSTVRRE